jgi:hypothetical protein
MWRAKHRTSLGKAGSAMSGHLLGRGKSHTHVSKSALGMASSVYRRILLRLRIASRVSISSILVSDMIPVDNRAMDNRVRRCLSPSRRVNVVPGTAFQTESGPLIAPPRASDGSECQAPPWPEPPKTRPATHNGKHRWPSAVQPSAQHLFGPSSSREDH